MIQMKLGELVNATQAINSLLTAKLPIKTAYHLSRLGKAFGKEMEAYDGQRVSLIREMGDTDEQGNTKVKDENIPEFMRQLNELLSVEIKIDLNQVKVAELGEKAEVTARDLMVCEAFIVE